MWFYLRVEKNFIFFKNIEKKIKQLAQCLQECFYSILQFFFFTIESKE